jgi:hypothetical protein
MASAGTATKSVIEQAMRNNRIGSECTPPAPASTSQHRIDAEDAEISIPEDEMMQTTEHMTMYVF